MAAVEALIPNAEVRVPDHPGAPIELRGELDICELRSLRDVLKGATAHGSPVGVDLSGVTFLDARCARELVIRSFPRGPQLTLANASREAEWSLRACAKGLAGASLEPKESKTEVTNGRS